MESPAGRGDAAAAWIPLQRVTVSGPSMVPTLRHGDRLLVHRGARARPGDVVLARFADLPDVVVVKRLVRWDAGGAVLASDNPAAGGDSRTHGAGEVLGRVLLIRHGRMLRRPRPAPDVGDL